MLKGIIPSVDISITPIVVPDMSRTIALSYQESSFSDDDIDVETANTREGSCLLQKVSASSEDKSGAVIEQVATIALRSITGLPGINVSPSAKGLAPAKTAPYTVELLLDGGEDSYATATAQLNAQLSAAGYNFTVSIVPLDAVPSPDAGYPKPDSGSAYEGILYRTPQPYKFSVLRGQATAAEAVFYSESGMPYQLLPIKRSAFVKRETTITFVQGVPVTVETKKPSEVLAAVSIPLDIVTAILAAPGQLLTFRVNNTQSKGQLEANEATIIENQQTLLEKQKALEAYLKSQ
jgi:hypothetical protein